jgi:hypothetical protein
MLVALPLRCARAAQIADISEAGAAGRTGAARGDRHVLPTGIGHGVETCTTTRISSGSSPEGMAMAELFFAILIFGLAFLGLSIGVLRGRTGITGSCGGLNQIPGIESDCGGACRSGRSCPNKAPTTMDAATKRTRE